jgi:hypothetical protein
MLNNTKINHGKFTSASEKEGLASSLITLALYTTCLTATVLAQVAIGSLVI